MKTSKNSGFMLNSLVALCCAKHMPFIAHELTSKEYRTFWKWRKQIDQIKFDQLQTQEKMDGVPRGPKHNWTTGKVHNSQWLRRHRPNEMVVERIYPIWNPVSNLIKHNNRPIYVALLRSRVYGLSYVYLDGKIQYCVDLGNDYWFEDLEKNNLFFGQSVSERYPILPWREIARGAQVPSVNLVL